MGDHEQIARNIAAFIRCRRRELGLSLDQVAARAGCTKSHVWELEKGRSRNPTIAMVLALSDALQCSLSSLLGFDVGRPWITDQERALVQAHREIFGRALRAETGKEGER